MVYGEWDDSGAPHYGHLMCKNCFTIFERDYVGSKNIQHAGIFNLLTGIELHSDFSENVRGIKRSKKRKGVKRKAGSSAFLSFFPPSPSL
jgi:hypothetical protein